MNLRVAKKICKTIGTSRESAYGGKIHIALTRVEKYQRKVRVWFKQKLRQLPVETRAKMLQQAGHADQALRLLVEDDK